MLRIIILQIKKQLHSSKTKLFLLIFSQITALICVLLTYGISSDMLIEKAEINESSMTFIVELYTPNNQAYQSYDEFSSKIQDILISCDENFSTLLC
ncbi:MAG: hypothetical protein NC120_06200, partial [Ruminococcus sp.]|nr:hypothetical protein [Ruminococcus sp.]